MCGIAGWYRRAGQPVAQPDLAAQIAALRHRGPDDFGLFLDGDFGAAQSRLSIIDLAGGHQPMTSACGRYVVVFNGEIYNHLELRRDLAAAGVVFSSHSDTETILEGFARWGHAVWGRLEGMFAVALWDRRTRDLHLARDPLGVKPLYLARFAGGLAFASELKALTNLPGLQLNLDIGSVADFFRYGHMRQPRSIYQEISQLPQGHRLTIPASGPEQGDCFWRLRFQPPARLSEADWIEGFRTQLLETVERHLLADVPVGTFLSGGVDSSAITAAMARVTDQPIKAFTIGFPVEAFDETPFAREAARHLGLDHRVEEVDLRATADILPTIQRCYDEPFADPSAIPSWYLARLAAREVKVVLAGDGSDELFAGYTRHTNERIVQRLNEWPAPLRALGGLVDWLPPLPSTRWAYFRQRAQKIWADARIANPTERFLSKTSVTPADVRARLFSAQALSALGDHAALELERLTAVAEAASADPLEQILALDAGVQLPCHMLTKVDRASMAHSLEVRVPFLSHKLADWALAAPVDMKLHGSTRKYIVRKAIEPWLPAGFLDRRKQGFAIPLAEWYRGALGAEAQQLCRDSGALSLSLFAPGVIDQAFAEHRSSRRDHSPFLYALTMFCLWWANRPANMTATV
jgi:asparagine synthase (glutamine-hydrolysing)